MMCDSERGVQFGSGKTKGRQNKQKTKIHLRENKMLDHVAMFEVANFMSQAASAQPFSRSSTKVFNVARLNPNRCSITKVAYASNGSSRNSLAAPKTPK